MKNKIIHVGIAGGLVALLIILSNQFMIWMPDPTLMVVLLAVTFLIVVWMGFVIYESAGDEREQTHTLFAGRVAYLSGVAVLTVALVVQGLHHDIDPWVLLALGIMVVSKLFARFYSDTYQ